MLRRKGILVALAIAATLVVGVSSAFAAKKYTTKIVYLGNNSTSVKDVTLYGDLNTNRKCRSGREVGLFKQTKRGFKLLDVDLSSFNGAWALRADLTGLPELAIKVTREKRNHGKVLCRGRTVGVSPGSPNYPRAR
jgi:hypothetical protein